MILFLIILIAVSILPASAQPQAPVAWGPTRWTDLEIGSTLGALRASGDTLIFLSRGLAGGGERPITAFSPDNGITFNDWQVIDTIGYSALDAHIAASSGRAYVLWQNLTEGATKYWRLSRNGGATWETNPHPTQCCWHSAFASGMTAIFMEGLTTSEEHQVRALISANGGESFQSYFVDSVYVLVEDNGIGLTHSSILLAGIQHAGHLDELMAIARAPRVGTPWTGFSLMPDQPYASILRARSIAADTASETAIVLSVWETASGAWHLWTTRSTDSGESWATPVRRSEALALAFSVPAVFCRGKLWGFAWRAFRSGNWPHGIYWRFSANHGKDWYPPQLVDSVVFLSGVFTAGQFVGNEARLYWQDMDSAAQPYHLIVATGVVTADTLPPDIVLEMIGPDTIRVGDTLRFDAAASDNDTLSEVTAVIADSGDQRYSILLERTAPGSYGGYWVVPHGGWFDYKAEAEDFWENVASYPDSGWLSFVAEPRSDADDPFIVHPSSFIVSVFPNPTNGAVTIRFTGDWWTTGNGEIEVFNVLGRRVALLPRPQAAGEAEVHWPLTDRFGNPLCSGLYFLTVSPHQPAVRLIVVR
jgi:hypothetical protein